MENSEAVNLLVTIDKKYLEPLATMLLSYGAQHRATETHVYIAHSALEKEDISYLADKVSEFSGISIHDIRITERWFSDTPVLERLPEESFYRLMAFTYLPESVEKCLYLDPDIFIMKNLMPLYETNLDGYYAAAAGHLKGALNLVNRLRLGIKQPRYINSGVLLMNIKAIRQDFSVESILQALEKHMQQLLFGDQDLINILFDRKTVYLDETIYNLDEKTLRLNQKNLDLQWVKENTAIIHYNGKYKPWLTGYEGFLNVFYPPVEKTGEATRGTLKNQVKAIQKIISLNKQQKTMLRTTFAVLVLCFVLYLFFGQELLQAVQEPSTFKIWLEKFGYFDEVVFILIRTVQTVLKIVPAVPIEIGAGYAWGAILGMLYCLVGNIFGTFVVLWLIRKYGTRIIERFFSVKNLKFLRVLQSSERLHWTLFFLYLIPVVPKDAITYFVSFLPVKVGPFLLVTTLARIPAILVITTCGATLAEQNYVLSAIVFGVTMVVGCLGLVFCLRKTKET